MGKQGRPARRTTSLIVNKRVPTIRIKNFCQKYGPVIMHLLNEFDSVDAQPTSNRFAQYFSFWEKTLQHNNIPVQINNQAKQRIVRSFYYQYRRQGKKSQIPRRIEATCFPKRIFYDKYECWYKHANKTKFIPDFCKQCRDRLDEHLGKNNHQVKLQFGTNDDQKILKFYKKCRNSIIKAFGKKKNAVKIQESQNAEIKPQQKDNQQIETIKKEQQEEIKIEQQKMAISMNRTKTTEQVQQKRKIIRKRRASKREVKQMDMIAEVKEEYEESRNF